MQIQACWYSTLGLLAIFTEVSEKRIPPSEVKQLRLPESLVLSPTLLRMLLNKCEF